MAAVASALSFDWRRVRSLGGLTARAGVRAEERGWELVVMSEMGGGKGEGGKGWGEVGGEVVVYGGKVAMMLRGESGLIPHGISR